MGNMRLPFINSDLLYEVPFKAAMNLRGLLQGRIQDFKLGGAHLKKLRRTEGGANIFEVFRILVNEKKKLF